MNGLLRILTSPLRKIYWTRRFDEVSRECTRTRPDDFPPRKDHRLRVGWVLGGNEWLGSARVKGFIINRQFQEKGSNVFSRVLYHPDNGDYLHANLIWKRKNWEPLLAHIDVLSFQTRAGDTLDLLTECRRRSIRTVFSISDYNFENLSLEVLDITDAIVVSSEFLAEKLQPLHSNIHVIDDPVEVPDDLRRVEHNRGRNPELIWFGHPDHWEHVVLLQRLLEKEELKGCTLRTISRHADATHQWTPEDVWENARHSDIAVIPTDLDNHGKSKSSNRLTALLSLGYPIVAGPIPSYTIHLFDNENGFFATTDAEWIQALSTLRDPDARQKMGDAARATNTLRELRSSRVAARWQTLFEGLISPR